MLPDSSSLASVPRNLGAGVGLRKDHFEELPESERRVDWLEVIPENFMQWGGRARRALEACRDRWPLIPHSVSLDIGGVDPLSTQLLDDLAEFCAHVDAPFFSDHLCYCRVDGIYTHDLLPLPANPEVADYVVDRIRRARDHVGRPFVLENPTYYADMPGSSLPEAEFLSRIVEDADCGLLLDVNNVYVNSLNHGYDPVAFIDQLPLHRVYQVHLAGHDPREVAVIDTHGTAVPDPVWDLYRHLLQHTGPVSTLIEWDQNIPPLSDLLDEADKARALLDAHQEVAS